MRLRAILPALLWLTACGGPQPPSHEREAVVESQPVEAPRDEALDEQAGSAEPEPAEAETEPVVAEPEGEPPPPGTLEELFYFGFEARERAEPMPSPAEALAECPPFRGQGQPGPEWYHQCRPREMIARTQRGWLALEIDWEEGGVGELHLLEGNAARQTERIGGALTLRPLEAIRSALERSGAHPLDDQIGRVVPMDFSLGTYYPLVELTDSEWLLWVEVTRDLDDPEWVLWLVSEDGETKHEVARREAELGPCDAGGYWCEATQAPCDAADLRAEGRLCVLPLGLLRVAIHGDELAVIGAIMIPGHGGMPRLTWFAELPEL